MQKRNINIDFARIIAMLFIVYHHFYIHSNWPMPNQMGMRKYIILTFGNFGKIGVILFILISGYFMYKHNFTFKKIICLNNTVTFYTIIFFIVTLTFIPFSIKNLIMSLFPIIFNQYWFITGYVILLIFQPFFKPYILHFDRRQKLTCFLTLLGLFYIPSTFGFIFQIDKYFQPSLYFIFILIALLGDLIREYEVELKSTYLKYTIITCLSTLSIIQLKPFILKFLENHDLAYPGYIINDTASLNAILFASCLFVLILKIHIPRKYKEKVLSISICAFEVYLLHDNPLFRSFLWNNLINNPKYYWSPYLVLIIIIEPLIVFFICLCLVKFRIILFKKIKIDEYFLSYNNTNRK